MRFISAITLGLAAVASAMPAPALVNRDASCECDRACMTNIVNEILQSMRANDPYSLPLAKVYKATENSHAAALDMMTLWRTVTKADLPSLLAVDVPNGSAYFSLDISEGNDAKQSVLWARIKVVNKEITELELFVNRSRGDHGFSLSPEELPENFARWMSPPANRTRASRETLENISAATFDPNNTFPVPVASDCQFTEEGWRVVDPGPDYNGSYANLPCFWPPNRPADPNARLNLVIDEEYGIVITGAVIPGKVYPYGRESAFIPNGIAVAQQLQDEWFRITQERNDTRLLAPTSASGESFQVLQFYNGELQGQQIMLYLGGPGQGSAWLE